MPQASFWQGRRVFLTGHTGFKGSWLSILLADMGAEVVGFSNGVPTVPSLFELARVEESLARSIRGDVRSLDAVEAAVRQTRPNIVVHMAAQPLVRESYRDPIDTYATNVLGTAHVLEAVRGVEEIDVVMVVTSDKCYDPFERDGPYVETDRLGGPDPYSASKACAELVVHSFRESFFNSSSPRVCTARAGNVIGGGDWGADRIVPDVVRAITEGSVLELRNPQAVRPWQHVLDCLSGYLRLIETAVETNDLPHAWNFGPDPQEARSVGWLVDAFFRRAGRSADISLLDSGGFREADHLLVDSSQARRLLDWSPNWGIEVAVAQTAEWYRSWWAGDDLRAVSLAQISAHRGEV